MELLVSLASIAALRIRNVALLEEAAEDPLPERLPEIAVTRCTPATFRREESRAT